MKAFANRLLVRTALLFALVLIVSQLIWVAVSAGLFLEPFRTEYIQLLASDVKMARAALEMVPAEKRPAAIERLGRESGIRIVAGDTIANGRQLASPEALASRASAVRELAGNDVELRTSPADSMLWMRFRAEGDPYWLLIRLARVPQLFSTALLLTASIAVLAALVGAYLLIAQLNGRLRSVVDAARTIGRGEIPARLPIAGPQEIRELSHGFNQMSEGLQRLESDRRLMLAGISHDLRTPLSRLRLGVELSRPAMKPAHALGMIHDITEMDGILEQFLCFTRDYEEEPPQVCDLNALVLEICSRYQLSDEEVSTRLGPLHPVRLRKLAVRRLIANLVDNGVRYGKKDVQVATSAHDAQVVLTVADRGPGIQTARPQELIRAFAREDTSRSASASGLGLAVVDGIARAHGGSLTLENRDGGGLLARVTLVPVMG